MGEKVAGRAKRRRAALYTQVEAAALLGISRRTLQRIEADPLPAILTRYLDLIGYRVAFYPRRNRKTLDGDL